MQIVFILPGSFYRYLQAILKHTDRHSIIWIGLAFYMIDMPFDQENAVCDYLPAFSVKLILKLLKGHIHGIASTKSIIYNRNDELRHTAYDCAVYIVKYRV